MAGVTLGGIPIKAPVKQIKVKKRVTPTSMTGGISIASSSSNGNIAMLPNAEKDITSDLTKAADSNCESSCSQCNSCRSCYISNHET